MLICLVAGLLLAPLDDMVTLRWHHSIEKILWEEDYRRAGDALHLIEARVRGSGAGMEPPADATFENGAWHYRPALPALQRVVLRHSPYVPAYEICAAGRCQPVTQWLPGLPDDSVIELGPCSGET